MKAQIKDPKIQDVINNDKIVSGDRDWNDKGTDDCANVITGFNNAYGVGNFGISLSKSFAISLTLFKSKKNLYILDLRSVHF